MSYYDIIYIYAYYDRHASTWIYTKSLSYLFSLLLSPQKYPIALRFFSYLDVLKAGRCQQVSQTSWDDSHLRNLWVNDSHKGGPLFFVTICYHHFTCLFTLYLGCLEQPCICFPLGKSRAEPGRCLDRRWRAVRTSLTKDLARENDGIYSDILMIWDRIRRCDI